MKKFHWTLEKSALCLILLFMGTIIYFGVQGFNQREITTNKDQEMNHDWTMVTEGESSLVTLPQSILLPDMETVSFSHTVTEEEAKAGNEIYIVTYYSDMNLYVDGEKIDSYVCKKTKNHPTQGMTYQFYNLPDNMVGKTITIEYMPQIDVNTFRITAPHIGQQDHIFMNIFRHEIWNTLLVALLLFMSIVVLVFAAASWRHHLTSRKVLTSIGLIALICGLYLGVNQVWFVIYLQNSLLVYNVEFLTQLLIMMPMLLMLHCVTYGKSKKLITIFLYMNLIECSVQYLLYLFTPIELREMLTVSHVVMFISIGAGFFVVFCLREIKDDYRKELTHAAVPLGVLGIADVVAHYISPSIENGVYMQVGIIAFVAIEMYYNLVHYEKGMHLEEENRIYRDIAYHDLFTGLKNRNAYEEACQDLEDDKEKIPNITSAVFDLNQLKLVNDTDGHAAGDALIKRMAELLANVFSEENVFRTGGDEFVVILTDVSREESDKLFDKLEKKNRTFHISFTYGVAYYDRDRYQTIMELIRDADNRMYENKRKYHATIK